METQEKTFEPLSYKIERPQQLAAVAHSLGYNSEASNGSAVYHKQGSSHLVSEAQASKNVAQNSKEGAINISQQGVAFYFNKEAAIKDFDAYAKTLEKQHGVSLVKGNGQEQGFTVVDHKLKVAYADTSLYKHAFDANILLDGRGTKVQVPLNDLKAVGADPSKISASDLSDLQSGRKTGMMKLSIEDNPFNRELLKKEKVDFKVEDGKLQFEGKMSALKSITAENNEQTRNELKKKDIDFKDEGSKLKIEGINLRKLAITAIILTSPIAGVALLLTPKREEIKNDFHLSKTDIKLLKSGAVLPKTDGNKEKVLYQLDKDTNEVVSVRSKDVSIPNKINGVNLSPIEKESIKKGREVNLQNDNGQSFSVKLDLNAKNGIAISDPNGQKMGQTQGTPSKELDQKQKLDFIADKGIQGVYLLFKDDAEKRDAFLKTHKLDDAYGKYKTVNAEYNSKDSGMERHRYELEYGWADKDLKKTAKEASLNFDVSNGQQARQAKSEEFKLDHPEHTARKTVSHKM